MRSFFVRDIHLVCHRAFIMNQVLQFECLFLLNLAVFAVTFIFILLVFRVIKSFRQKGHEAPVPVVRGGGFSTVV